MKDEAANENAEDAPPNFEPSGLLALDSNSRNGTLLKHYEPPDAREPAEHWRLYLYKGAQDDESSNSHMCDDIAMFVLQRYFISTEKAVGYLARTSVWQIY
eukprot:Filipodium_phascolosomae@DN2488_c0_g1_i3.p1